MAFILTKDRPNNSADEWTLAWLAYTAYLESIKGLLPSRAYEFATAEWHYNFENHMSPHDAWLEGLAISERRNSKLPTSTTVDIRVSLLGAYHDGRIELAYYNVREYSLFAALAQLRGHLDLLYDEVRLSESGRVVHEVEWSSSGNWIVECEDLAYTWSPLSGASEGK